MTGGALTRLHIVVTEGRRRPGVGGVAAIAGVGGWDMQRVLAGGIRAIVTGGALTRLHIVVTKGRWRPGVSGMAAIAGVGGRNMNSVFALSKTTVMASCTLTRERSLMTESDNAPCRFTVAEITLLCRWRVVRRH